MSHTITTSKGHWFVTLSVIYYLQFFLHKSRGKPNVLAIHRGSQLRKLTSLLRKWPPQSEHTWRTLKSSHRYVCLSLTHRTREALGRGVVSSAPFNILAALCCCYILHCGYSLLCRAVLLQGGSNTRIREQRFALWLVTSTKKLYQVEELGTHFTYIFLLSCFVVIITKNACGFSMTSLKTEAAP